MRRCLVRAMYLSASEVGLKLVLLGALYQVFDLYLLHVTIRRPSCGREITANDSR